MGPNLLSAGLLSMGRTAQWTMIGHHISHGGYARTSDHPRNQTSTFAPGRRRMRDWMDVILPEAWDVEHNTLHHSRLGEAADPDLVKLNLDWLRTSSLPLPARYAIVLTMAGAWKWIDYAPNTLQELQASTDRSSGGPGERRRLLDWRVWAPLTRDGRTLWMRCFLPYATLRTFVIITTNHAGEDVYAFDTAPSSREDFLLRQILGSVNYRTGSDLNGWLNDQIEHHLWPDMSMRQYQRAQPRLQALCERHGVPYIQEPAGTRLRRTLDIMVGRTDMKRAARAV